MNFNIRKVLVAPLDWGLGHATRCIPIIRGLLTNGYQVIIAAEGPQAHLLLQEFPSLVCLPLAGYRVRYSKNRWALPFTLVQQLPGLFATIRQEHHWLDEVIHQHQIDLVISDNRYGLSSKKIPCIFITHQLTIKAPFGWMEKILQRINYHYINRFTCCWVPDAEGDVNAAGILSHPAQLPVIKILYIGLLARFQQRAESKKYDYCILLSGPEPQRTLLENQLIAGIGKLNGNILLVRGKPGNTEALQVPDNVKVVNHLPTPELQKALLQSDYIVSRSGYTTIMEILALQKKSILIPTPGQTEQEYLAKKLQQSHACMSIAQKHFDCSKHFSMAKDYPYQLPVFPVCKDTDLTRLLQASV